MLKLCKLLLAFVGHLLLCWLGSKTANTDLNSEVYFIWPVAGYGLALIILGGVRNLIPIIAGLWTWGLMVEQDSIAYLSCLTVAYAASAFIPAKLSAYFLNRNFALETVGSVFVFIMCGPVLAGLISSCIGTAALCWVHSDIPWREFGRFWRVWWMADTVGGIVAAPFFIVYLTKVKIELKNRQIFEVVLWLVSLIILGSAVFRNWAPSVILGYPLELVVFPVVAWGAVRFGQRGAAGGVVILAILAILELEKVLGPGQNFISESPTYMWVFIGVISVTAFFLSSILSEVTVREERHAQNESRLRAFIDAMPDVAYVISAEGYYLEAFGPSHARLSVTIEQFKDTHISDNWNVELAELFMRTIRSTLEELTPRNLEYHVIIDDDDSWFEGRVAPMCNESGVWDRVIWVAYDITERKRAEAAIQYRDQLIQGAAKANAQLLYITNKEDAISQAIQSVGISARVNRVLIFKNFTDGDTPRLSLAFQWVRSAEMKVEAEKIDGATWDSLFKGWYSRIAYGKAGSNTNNFYPESTEKLKSLGIESVMMVPIWVNSELWGSVCFENTGTNCVWDESEVASLFVTAGSLGAFVENKQNEEALHKAKESADSANAAKSEFLAMMSHEIRTPMNAILGFTDLLSRTKLSSSQQETLKIISRSGENLLELINNILDFSKIESRAIELEFRSFKLETALFEALELMLIKAKQKKLKINYRSHDDGPKYFWGDSYRIKQILLNLVNNAIKFTKEGSVDVAVHITALGHDDLYEVKIEVIDTGIGIPQEKLSRLFQPFSQVDSSTTRRYGGTGLGLVICKRLVEKMGGEIHVQSKVGEGSCFYFSIKLKASDEVSQSRRIEVSDNLSAEFSQKYPLNILLVEDDSVNQKLFSVLFKSLGYSIDMAGDDIEAERLLTTKAYDLIFMDVQLPGKSGLEIIADIKAGKYMSENQVAYKVVLTAFALPEDRQRCLDAGADNYLSKPIRAGKLKEMLALGYAAINKKG